MTGLKKLLNKLRLINEEQIVSKRVCSSIKRTFVLFNEKAAESVESDRTVTVTQAVIAFMLNNWKKRWNRSPTGKEKKGIIREHIKQMVFYRVALEMGLDKNDDVIKCYLVYKLQFITNDLIKPQEPGEDELKRFFNERKIIFRVIWPSWSGKYCVCHYCF